jgi:hypothetical protein
MSYDQLKERYKAQILYYVNTYPFTYIATCIQCGLDTLLNLPFKSNFLIYKFILNTNKRWLVFATSRFDLYIIFHSMLSIFELCQRKQDPCLVYILVISECYISRVAQQLAFIFCVPIGNTLIKNVQYWKRHMKVHLELWLCPFHILTRKRNVTPIKRECFFLISYTFPSNLKMIEVGDPAHSRVRGTLISTCTVICTCMDYYDSTSCVSDVFVIFQVSARNSMINWHLNRLQHDQHNGVYVSAAGSRLDTPKIFAAKAIDVDVTTIRRLVRIVP